MLNIDVVTGMKFDEPGKLLIETQHLGEVHKILPKIIVESGTKVTGIDNPDDDLQSILLYLTGGAI